MFDVLSKAWGVPVLKITFNQLKYLNFFWLSCRVAVFSVDIVG